MKDGIKTLQQFAEAVSLNKNNPHALAELHIDIASKYAFLGEVRKDLQLERAEFWQQKYAGEKPLSDTFIETKWLGTEGGKKELRIKIELKSLEALMGAIKTSSVIASIEARNII